jgi:RTX calcium-binding nonapeptide repeat (4 copies)
VATVNAYNGYNLNMLNLNLSKEAYYGTSRSIYTNVTDVYGTTYPSVYSVDMNINGAKYRDFFAGNFSTNAGAVTSGTVSAYYEYIWNGYGWALADSLRNFSYSAVDFYNAAISGAQSTTTWIEVNVLRVNDTITGSTGNDILYGGIGNDIINGGGGTDTALYMGNRSDYTIFRNANGSTSAIDHNYNINDGTDILYNVEYLRFMDQTVAVNNLAYYVGGNGANGPSLLLSASNTAVVERGNSRVTLKGSNDAVTMGAHSNLTVYGSNNRVAATTGDGIWINSGTGETITGAGFTVHGGARTGFTVGGNSLAGANDVVYGSSASVALKASSHMSLTGSNDAVTMGAHSNLTVYGSNDRVAATTGDGIWVNSGTGDTITGSGFTVHGGARTGFTIKGTADVVYAGLNDAITDSGSHTLFKINSNVGKLSISHFDPTGIIDLLNGVGGYTSASQAFATLTSDGHGGSLLSLGSKGSIDLVGEARSSLHASNFKIG